MMGTMGIPDRQTSYWDSVAGRKTFTHPLWLGPLLAETPLDARILDYGCGYGRTCIELSQAGFRDVTGIDISREMIARGRREHPGIDLRVFDGLAIPFADNSFQTCTLLAVLTCIPSDAEQERVVAEIHRVLRPGGLLHVSDYPIQDDKRNRDRYRQFAPVFGMARACETCFGISSSPWTAACR